MIPPLREDRLVLLSRRFRARVRVTTAASRSTGLQSSNSSDAPPDVQLCNPQPAARGTSTQPATRIPLHVKFQSEPYALTVSCSYPSPDTCSSLAHELEQEPTKELQSKGSSQLTGNKPLVQPRPEHISRHVYMINLVMVAIPHPQSNDLQCHIS
jgi:hypothetical protein